MKMNSRERKIEGFVSRLKDVVLKSENKNDSIFVTGKKWNYDFKFAENRVFVYTKEEEPKVFEVAQAFKNENN